MRPESNYLVVLNYNDFETTDCFLSRAIRLHTVNGIIVVDNCSTDESFSRLKSKYGNNVVVLRTTSNGGYGAGNNFGIRYAISKFNADLIFVANPDTSFNDASILEIEAVFQDYPDAGIVSCRMESNATYNALPAWRLPSYCDCLKEALPGGDKVFKVRNSYKEEYLCNSSPVLVDVLPGSFFAISSKAFEAVGGFDESTFLYYEENILSYKLMSKGFRNYLVSTTHYQHYHSVSINKEYGQSLKKFKIAQDSRMVYCRTCLNIGLAKRLSLSLVFHLGLAMYRLFTMLKTRRK